VSGEAYKASLSIADIQLILGSEKIEREQYEDNDHAGVVTGLAWSQSGGSVLFVESAITAGKGNLVLTGQLGDVMKESATLARTFIKSKAHILGIDSSLFDAVDIHIHFPAGAIPKDGPSAGVTILTALASLFTQRKVRAKLAMTGEITLRGKVLPVGGIKEKILAAKRAGITDVLLCEGNRKDIEDINPDYVRDMRFHYVKNMEEVLDIALTKEQVSLPIDLASFIKKAVETKS
jgi:ATP-dependent Lon protease